MSDPERLSGSGGDELRSLLAAGKSEVPDGAQMMALAAKIALIGAAGAGGVGGAGAVGAAGGASAAKATATAGAAIKTALALKVIGAIAVVGVAGTTAVVVTRRDAPPPPAPIGLVATATVAASGAMSAPAPMPSEAEFASAPVPMPSASAPRPKPSTTSESPEAEVKLLERAQDALRSRPEEALALCNDHAKRFPNGMLVQEREVIAIEALVKTGRKTEARARADRFEARFLARRTRDAWNNCWATEGLRNAQGPQSIGARRRHCMKYNLLGSTGIYVSELCLGAMTFGGKGFWEVVGKLGEKEVESIIGTSIDAGINFIDTADVYSEGESETLVGKALKSLNKPREQLVIATKVRGRTGPGPNEVGLSRAHILASIDNSLKRSASITWTSIRSTASTRRCRSRRPCARSTTSCAPARRATSASATCRRGSR